MTPYQGLLFFGILILLLLPAAFFGLRGKNLRVLGAAFTALMLLTAFDSRKALITLAVFWLWQSGLCFSYLAVRKRWQKRWMLWLFVLFSLVPLILVKLSALVPPLRFFSLLGVSYMSFRAVQVLIELYDGRIKELNFLDFGYFLLFFPSVSSGPIDRYRRFAADLHAERSPEDYRAMLQAGVWKLMTGALYNFVFANLIWQFWLAKLPEHGLLATWSHLYGYTFYMFFNFAGYSRMAVGTAYVLGVKLPGNFDRPFLACDMKEFWSRWHISLSTWLRDYVYTRFCMAALRGKWFRSQRTSSYLGYFLTMTLMGVWHGLTPAYLVYGVYHGLLMSANEVLDTKWKGFKKLKKRPVPRAIMTVITFHLFGFGLLIFSGRLF